MSDIIGDTACLSCIKTGGDKTKNHLMLFEDGGAFCNRCGYTCDWKKANLSFTERKIKTKEEIDQAIEEFSKLPVKPWSSRGLRLATVQRYNAKCEVDNNSVIQTFVNPVWSLIDNKYTVTGTQTRLASQKRFYCSGEVKKAVLFGQQLLPATGFKKLFICESPIDCMSLYQAIKDNWKGTKWQDMEPYVVALPHGTGCAVEVIGKNLDKIKKAEEIILVFDNDKAGQDAVLKVKSLIPNIKNVLLPRKDCNELLVNGESQLLAKLAMFENEIVKLDSVIDIGDIVDDILAKPVEGLSYPWPSLTKLTHGIRPQEIIGFAGGVGIGKSDVKYEIAQHLVLNHNVTVGIFDLEAVPKRTGKAIIGKMLKKFLHNPDMEYTEEEVRGAIEKCKGRIKLYKHRGNKGWEEIKTTIRHMVVVDKVTHVFLDPMTALVSDLSSSEANDVLNTIMSDLSTLTHELDFTLFYFAHLNPPKTGVSHERGGKVLESQLTGSRAMIKWSHYIIGLERNKDPELQDYERNTLFFVLLKDREFGNVGKFPTHWNSDTGVLREMQL